MPPNKAIPGAESPPPLAANPFAEVSARGSVDYLLRNTQQHHVQLSLLADTKANIVITVASIVMTMAMGRVNDPVLCWAAIVLIGFSLLALLTAILAVLPKFRPPVVKGAVLPDGFNLLFFGHFASLGLPRFQHEVALRLQSDSAIYDTVTRDIYALGSYLATHKYPYLRLSYLFFLSGLVCAAVLQTVLFFLHR